MEQVRVTRKRKVFETPYATKKSHKRFFSVPSDPRFYASVDKIRQFTPNIQIDVVAYKKEAMKLENELQLLLRKCPKDNMNIRHQYYSQVFEKIIDRNEPFNDKLRIVKKEYDQRIQKMNNNAGSRTNAKQSKDLAFLKKSLQIETDKTNAMHKRFIETISQNFNLSQQLDAAQENANFQVSQFDYLRRQRDVPPKSMSGWNCLIEENKALLDVLDDLKIELHDVTVKEQKMKQQCAKSMKVRSMPSSPSRWNKKGTFLA